MSKIRVTNHQGRIKALHIDSVDEFAKCHTLKCQMFKFKSHQRPVSATLNHGHSSQREWWHQKCQSTLFHQRYTSNLFWCLAAGRPHQLIHSTPSWQEVGQKNNRKNQRNFKLNHHQQPLTRHYVNSQTLCVNNSGCLRRDENHMRTGSV